MKCAVDELLCSNLDLPSHLYLHVPLERVEEIGGLFWKNRRPFSALAENDGRAAILAALLAPFRAGEPGLSLVGFDARCVERRPKAYPLRLALHLPPGSRGCLRSRHTRETVATLAERGFRVCVERTSDDRAAYRLLFPLEDVRNPEWRDPESGAWISSISSPSPFPLPR